VFDRRHRQQAGRTRRPLHQLHDRRRQVAGPTGVRCDVDGNVWLSSNAGPHAWPQRRDGVEIPPGSCWARIRLPEVCAQHHVSAARKRKPPVHVREPVDLRALPSGHRAPDSEGCAGGCHMPRVSLNGEKGAARHGDQLAAVIGAPAVANPAAACSSSIDGVLVRALPATRLMPAGK